MPAFVKKGETYVENCTEKSLSNKGFQTQSLDFKA